MTDRGLKAVDVALDFSKQQTRFASVLLSVTLAFSGSVLEKLPLFAKILAAVSWVFLLVSIAAGLFVLGITSYQLSKDETAITRLLRDSHIGATVQLGLLAVAATLLIAVMVAGFWG